jgi:hypothetical protein
VDPSRLTLEAGAIRGEATVIVYADAWFPPNDGGPLAARYTIDARIDGATIAGEYEGTVGVEFQRAGKVEGEIVRKGERQP